MLFAWLLLLSLLYVYIIIIWNVEHLTYVGYIYIHYDNHNNIDNTRVLLVVEQWYISCVCVYV